MTPGQWGFDRM